MSVEQLAGLDAERAFFPRGRFHELYLDYVPFDDLTDSHTVDSRIDRALRAEAGCITVIGPSGAGKSAAIAAAVERLRGDFPCLRVPVAAIGEVAGNPVAFGQHVLRAAVQQAAELLAAHQRQDLQAAAADRTTTRRAPRGIAARLRAAIPGFSVELAGDLKESALEQEQFANASDVIKALNRLVGIFEGRGGPPILIFEDTDAWLGAPNGLRTSSAANQFFSQSLGVLIRDVEIRSIIATHTRYAELDGYHAIRARLLTEVVIPPLSDPRAAISAILQRRIDVSQVDASVSDAFTEDALTRLVAEYDHSDRSIRHLLQVCDTALEQTAPTYPDRLTEDHLRGASVALTGHG
jgi:Cdc6-like AAA superfamily ATPase